MKISDILVQVFVLVTLTSSGFATVNLRSLVGDDIELDSVPVTIIPSTDADNKNSSQILSVNTTSVGIPEIENITDDLSINLVPQSNNETTWSAPEVEDNSELEEDETIVPEVEDNSNLEEDEIIPVSQNKTSTQQMLKASYCSVDDLTTATSIMDTILHISEEFGLIKYIAGKFDPLEIKNVPLPSKDFSIAGKKHTLSATLSSAKLSGLSAINVGSLKAKSPTEITFDYVEVDGKLELSMNLFVSLSKDPSYFDKFICFFKSSHCEPVVANVVSKVGITKPEISNLDFIAEVMHCAGDNVFDKLYCKWVSFSDWFNAIWNGNVELAALNRIKNIQFKNFDVNFDMLTDSDIVISNASDFTNDVINAITSFGRWLINEPSMKAFLLSEVKQIGLSAIENEIQKLSGNFKGYCGLKNQ